MHVEAFSHRGDASVRSQICPQGVQIVGLLFGIVGLDPGDVVDVGQSGFGDERPDFQEVQRDAVVLEQPGGGDCTRWKAGCRLLAEQVLQGLQRFGPGPGRSSTRGAMPPTAAISG